MVFGRGIASFRSHYRLYNKSLAGNIRIHGSHRFVKIIYRFISTIFVHQMDNLLDLSEKICYCLYTRKTNFLKLSGWSLGEAPLASDLYWEAGIIYIPASQGFLRSCSVPNCSFFLQGEQLDKDVEVRLYVAVQEHIETSQAACKLAWDAIGAEGGDSTWVVRWCSPVFSSCLASLLNVRLIPYFSLMFVGVAVRLEAKLLKAGSVISRGTLSMLLILLLFTDGITSLRNSMF